MEKTGGDYFPWSIEDIPYGIPLSIRDLQGRILRVVEHGGVVTEEFIPGRVTIYKGENGRIRTIAIEPDEYEAGNYLGAKIQGRDNGPPFGPPDRTRYGKCKSPGCPCSHYDGKGTGICFTRVDSTFPPGRCGHGPEEHETEIL